LRFVYNENNINNDITEFIKGKDLVSLKEISEYFKFDRTYASRKMNKLIDNNENIKSQLITERRGSLTVTVKYFKFQQCI